MMICDWSAQNTQSTQIQQVTQFHITNWSPDGVCTNLATITDVIEEVDKVQRRTGNQPIVVYCRYDLPLCLGSCESHGASSSPSSDTVGRSGMFCAITMVTQQCKTEGVVDVFQTVKSIRTQKPGAVLTVVSHTSCVIQHGYLHYVSMDTGPIPEYLQDHGCAS